MAVDLPAMAAAVMTSISLHLVLALSLTILMPNDTTTSLSKSIEEHHCKTSLVKKIMVPKIVH